MNHFELNKNQSIRGINLCKAIFILFTLCLLFSCHTRDSRILADNGVLDAENWNLSKSNLELQGHWRFFWKQFLNPNDPDLTYKEFLAPGQHWTSIDRNGKPLPSFGYGTYRLDVILPANNDVLAISLPVLHTAYRLYIDGELQLENGVVSEYESVHKPSYHTRLIPIQNHKKTLRIQLHISNYTHKIAGMKEVILIGKIDKIYAESATTHMINWVIVFILLTLAGYHFIIYSLRKTELRSLYLGILYVGISCLEITLAEGRILFNLFSEDWCWEIIRFSKMGLPIIIYSGTCALSLLFYTRSYEYVIRFIKYYCLFLALVCAYSPRHYLVEWAYYLEVGASFIIAYGFLIILLAVFKNKRGSLLYLGSFLILGSGVFFDLLNNDHFIIGIAPLRFSNIAIFILPQTFILIRSIILIFKSEEKISRILARNNEILESQVKLRTSELEKANRWKANFVSLMSHDLRSPLNGVNQILDVMQFKFSSMPDLEKQRFLKLCKEGIQNSLRMLKSLLDVSRFDSDGIRLQPTELSLRMLLLEVVSSIQPIAEVKDISLDLNIEKDTYIIGDRVLLEEVFKNILTNAIKYSYPNTTIQIREFIRGDWVSIEIQDSGLGMDHDTIMRILGEKTSKSQAGTNGELGTGLGLKLCINILEAHFAKLKIQSEVGKGSKFEVQISKQLKSILLVDDADGFRKTLAEELRRRKWIVIEAKDGEDALNHLSRILPTIIVTDQEMPVMDGISFIHEWEARKGDLDIPLMLISSDAPFSNGEKFLKEEGLDDMVVCYASKLLPMNTLVKLISNYIK